MKHTTDTATDIAVHSTTDGAESAGASPHRQLTVKAKDGTILQRSHNLRGIRTLAGKVTFEGVSIWHAQDGGAYLDMQIAAGNGRYSGATFHADFASFAVLMTFVAQWRNVYGTPLYIDGKSYGHVRRDSNRIEVQP